MREHSNHNAFIRCCLFLNILQKYISLGNERVERGFSTIEERLKKKTIEKTDPAVTWIVTQRFSYGEDRFIDCEGDNLRDRQNYNFSLGFLLLSHFRPFDVL